jgi:hypothetical protein
MTKVLLGTVAAITWLVGPFVAVAAVSDNALPAVVVIDAWRSTYEALLAAPFLAAIGVALLVGIAASCWATLLCQDPDEPFDDPRHWGSQ